MRPTALFAKSNVSTYFINASTTFLFILAAAFFTGCHAYVLDRIGFHKANYDRNGKLRPWTSWGQAIQKEMEWYLKCPVGQNEYPVYFYAAFMNGNYKPFRAEGVPCRQLGMGILSYVKYWEYWGKSDSRIMKKAELMGKYLIYQALTADEGAYPRFPRSTGYYKDFPLRCSSLGDEKFGPNVIEPDKGGLAGYALVQLYRSQANYRNLEHAKHFADVLVRNMRAGDAQHAPWPFRVDAVTGKHWGERNGNMVYILRLFDELIALGFEVYLTPRKKYTV